MQRARATLADHQSNQQLTTTDGLNSADQEQPTGPTGAPAAPTRYPDRVVFDLDPGPRAGLAECVEVAFALRERLGPLAWISCP